MNVHVRNIRSDKTIPAPPSKSIAQRYILASALSKTNTCISNCGNSDDVTAMLEIIKNLGAAVKNNGHSIEIIPDIFKRSNAFHAGESGLATRLIIPVLSALGGNYKIDGKGSLLNRSFRDLQNILEKNGVNVESNSGKLPFKLNGKLNSNHYILDGSQSSQHISGMLMALPILMSNSELIIENLVSRSYVDLTLDVLKNFGIEIGQDSENRFTIRGNQQYHPVQPAFEIEGDYSGAANWIVAGAISENKITISGLNQNSLQGDRTILTIAEKAGAKIEWKKNTVSISKGTLIPFEFDATDTPDLFPPLVVLAAAASGMSTIKGVSRLVNKESNRALALQNEFAKLGLRIELINNDMVIHGNCKLKNGTIHSNNDHRIAMAGAIASLLTNDGITIENSEATGKSYPEFWSHTEID